MEFLSPLFLAGLAAAAVPVVIHLEHVLRADPLTEPGSPAAFLVESNVEQAVLVQAALVAGRATREVETQDQEHHERGESPA